MGVSALTLSPEKATSCSLCSSLLVKATCCIPLPGSEAQRLSHRTHDGIECQRRVFITQKNTA